MVSQVAITVKKNDGTTDIVYTNVQASGGDKAPAIWQSLTASTYYAFRPEMRISFAPNGAGSRRKGTLQYTYPVTAVGSDGKTYVSERANFEVIGDLPLGMTDADVNEAVSQCFNLLASAHVKAQFQARFAAT